MNRNTEEFFYQKLESLGLTASYSEDTVEQYGATHHRLRIKIFKGSRELEFTTGGFKLKSVYRDLAFEQGIRKLTQIEINERHK